MGLSTKDFFKGLISHSVNNGTLKVWSPYGFSRVQPYQPTSSKDTAKQAILYTIENDEGQHFFVAMSEDGRKCAISNDSLMAYELYWTANKSAGSDGISLTPNTNLKKWEPPTTQVHQGTIGFVIDQYDNSKYINVSTGYTEYLPKENFSETLAKILEGLEEYQKKIPGMSGRKDCIECLMTIYQNSIKNMTSLGNIVKKIERAYEENEIKENMALKAKLTEELEVLEFQVKLIEGKIKNNEGLDTINKDHLDEAISKRDKKLKEIQSQFRNP